MRIAVILTARPSWAKLAPLCAALRDPHDLTVIVCGSALLERYGRVVDQVREDYRVLEVWSTLEGTTRATSAIESGVLLTQLVGVLDRLQPDRVIVNHDRHEVLAAAMAASYLQIPLIHLGGGERSGSIDDKVRDAITALADVHLTATRQAAVSVVGRIPRGLVAQTGCPTLDLCRGLDQTDPVTVEEMGGVRPRWAAPPRVVWLQHPDTRSAEDAQLEAFTMADALIRLGLPVLAFWPGQDAGGEAMAKVLRVNKEHFHTVRTLPPRRFLRLLTQVDCLVGNSSAGIREASYLGVPVVNVGRRQDHRERGPNVVDVPELEPTALRVAIQAQLEHGTYPSSELYGDGQSAARMAAVIGRA